MIPSVYSIPGLFRLTVLILTVPDRTKPATVDDRGNPQIVTKQLALLCHLDGAGVRSLQASETYGNTSQSSMTYEGHLVIPDSSALLQLLTDISPEINIWMLDTMPPDVVEGLTCKASINGQEGTAKILPIEQTSLLAPYQAGFGDRIRVEFTRRQDWNTAKTS